jgi:hypothetical protein
MENPNTSFVMFAMTFISLSQSILQNPIYRLALDILKIVYSLPPVVVAPVSEPPTRIVRGHEVAVVEELSSDHIYLCGFAILSILVGFQLLLSRRSAFFTPAFKIHVGIIAKVFELAAGISHPLFAYSAAVTTVLELVSSKSYSSVRNFCPTAL